MKSWKVREWIAFMLCATVCMTILSTAASWAIRGPEVVPDSAREIIKELLIYIAGIVSAYLLMDKKQNS